MPRVEICRFVYEIIINVSFDTQEHNGFKNNMSHTNNDNKYLV